jgi:hypothetical protein
MRNPTQQTSRLDSLFGRLSAAGLPENYVRKMAFPSWWQDGLADDDGGYGRALGFVHHNVGIPLEVLWRDEAPITCPAHKVNFKKAQNLTPEDVQWARCLGVTAASIAASAMPPKVVVGPHDGRVVRETICGSGHECVNLDNLLEYVWSLGVPVLHLDNYPGKKMAGLAVRLHNRPAIVLCTNYKLPPKMLFDLAHELGHILLNHVGDDGVLVDAEIKRGEAVDLQERAANAFALATLLGDPDRVYKCGVNYTGERLAEWCREKGKRDGVLPGVVAQQYAHHKGHQGSASIASNILGGDDPVLTIRRKMFEKLDFENLTDDDAEFLARVAGKGASDAVPVGH